MPHFDLPLEQLRSYHAALVEPHDFDEFWRQTLADARVHPLTPTFVRVNDVYQAVEAYDTTFAGFGGQPIKAWLILPARGGGGADTPLPCLVRYVGYGGGRSLPIDHLAPAACGFALLVMDTRGQGSGWSPGDTPDDAGAGPHHPGFLTRGIESPETYYYRRVFTDAVRAVAAAASHPRVDPARIAVTGASQGGGIALAVAGLLGSREIAAAMRTSPPAEADVSGAGAAPRAGGATDPPLGGSLAAAPAPKLLVADVPFLCHYARAVQLVDTAPYVEITKYLRAHRQRAADVWRTLAYFDGVHFATRVAARTLFSVALMDATCPPSTVFAAYNELRAEKELRIYDFNEHEGGGPFQALELLRFATKHLAQRG